jgi:hypothetical protein
VQVATPPPSRAFHKVSAKYLLLYIAEFSFRYNNLENADIFSAVIANCWAQPSMTGSTLVTSPPIVSLKVNGTLAALCGQTIRLTINMPPSLKVWM